MQHVCETDPPNQAPSVFPSTALPADPETPKKLQVELCETCLPRATF